MPAFQPPQRPHMPRCLAWLRRLPQPSLLKDACPLVGGQAVMEGVMMRHQDIYAVAVRLPDGGIIAERFPWFSLTRGFLRRPFLRGFPVLLETMINGIRALNASARHAAQGEDVELDTWHLALTLAVSLGMAVLLFVIMPHLLSLGMQWLGLGGAVEGLTFHLWDGFFKCGIFIAYIALISLVPDIRRVFQFHGAEHKVIHAFEQGGTVTADSAAQCSRLHPRCGTTFLLFVISISIVLHALLVPLMLLCWTPESSLAKHLITLVFKLLLVVPISALAYELIRSAGRMGKGPAARALRAPGLFLQKLTTREPSREHLEVALVALAEALGQQRPESLHTPTYSTAA